MSAFDNIPMWARINTNFDKSQPTPEELAPPDAGIPVSTEPTPGEPFALCPHCDGPMRIDQLVCDVCQPLLDEPKVTDRGTDVTESETPAPEDETMTPDPETISQPVTPMAHMVADVTHGIQAKAPRRYNPPHRKGARK